MWRLGHVIVTRLTRGESHHIEYLFQLVVMVGTAGLHILLATVEDGFKGQKFGKYTTNSPDIYNKITYTIQLYANENDTPVCPY